ncbi:MAG: hypothetical protein Q4P32_11085, partial [Micrococcales bacterium]|nr:hypothetical protein [Micrococcales bacterium]
QPDPPHEQPVPAQLSQEQPPPPHRETVADPAGQPAPSRPVPGPPARVPAGATPAAQANAAGSAASESGAAHASSPPGPTQRVAGTHQAAGPAARTEGASAPQLAAQGAGPQTPGPRQTDATLEGPATSPSPALFARRKAARLVLPGARAATAEAASVAAHEGLTIALVDAVARQVVASWCSSATPDALADLTRGAPTIPAELDRALLVDLSSRAEGGDLDDRDRHDVRARFWYHVGRVRPI